ncbi:MAG: 16S rRNA (cytosine(1402)-N(4))-methyltransferase RsmH [Firmicutes bacterium]|nr:16S rRNA (cytosine(1402)-N(4))-methyltransferase RsmH [Bacillota bacterium]
MEDRSDIAFHHAPVLLRQTIEALRPLAGGVYIDGTLGGAGHASALLAAAPDSFLLGIDRDEDALAAAARVLAAYPGRFILRHDTFSHMRDAAVAAGIEAADGILLDLGVSSYQIDTAERGFSYRNDAPLDMRMDRGQGVTAADIVNTYTPEQLCRILFDYGEEKWAKRIVRFIVEGRANEPFVSTGQLATAVKQAIPVGAREKDQHPARRTFQALRIAVNGELDELKQGLAQAVELLRPQGRLAVITFHSLEDRIVKDTFREYATDCLCPKELPVCVCGHKASVKQINRKPIVAEAEELADNPRAHSAKLRIAEKL